MTSIVLDKQDLPGRRHAGDRLPCSSSRTPRPRSSPPACSATSYIGLEARRRREEPRRGRDDQADPVGVVLENLIGQFINRTAAEAGTPCAARNEPEEASDGCLAARLATLGGRLVGVRLRRLRDVHPARARPRSAATTRTRTGTASCLRLQRGARTTPCSKPLATAWVAGAAATGARASATSTPILPTPGRR